MRDQGSQVIRVASWNIRRIGNVERKLTFIFAQQWDMAVLLEVTPAMWAAVQNQASGVYALNLIGAEDMKNPHGVALVARPPWFLEAPFLPGARMFGEGDPRPERWLTATASSATYRLTLVGFHAPYAAGRTTEEKRDNRRRKRRSYEALTTWLTGQRQVIVGMDGNNWWDPVDHVADPRDPKQVDFWSERAFHALDPPHGLVDTYRRWCSDQVGHLDEIRALRPDGPLAVTHRTRRADGTGAFRMDRIYASTDVTVRSGGIAYEPARNAGSDHALVWADLDMAPA